MPYCERRITLQRLAEKQQCKFHMKNTGHLTNDIFKKTSLQLNKEEVVDMNSNPERYSGIYKELAELLGDAAMLKI